MNSLTPHLTEEQRSNLAKLAAYLRTLPPEYPDFEMRQFTTGVGGTIGGPARVPECGTAACAAGHGPVAGITPIEGETWGSYASRAFVGDAIWPWEWCFGQRWSKTDNTAHGAADRINWMLDHGVPEDCFKQQRGAAPLCYRAALAEQVPA